MQCYSSERNAQIVIALLKAHGIKRVVASPGATNASFVWMLQNDGDFELFSAIDERHAAYLACGMTEESQDPVVISCTGATSSRNYMAALTEAYYRKLPILAITSSMPWHRLGNLWPQMTDRYHLPNDTVRLSVQCPIPINDEEIRACEIRVNSALLELRRGDGGPVHINLETQAPCYFPIKKLPKVHKIERIEPFDSAWPKLPENLKIAVWIGSHREFKKDETCSIERFVRANNGVVFADRTSNYFGESAVSPSLLLAQGIFGNREYCGLCPDLIVHIGEISGDYHTFLQLRERCDVWRVNEDGELRDFLWGLSKVFEMPEKVFFDHYTGGKCEQSKYSNEWQKADSKIRSKLPEIPYSNIWVARELSERISKDSEIHFGILNSLRSWNLFPSNSIKAFCNVGGFGIDGILSSLIGASLINQDKLYFGVLGDLAFYYDLNSLGNRHIRNNLRIIVINNGLGVEFANPGSIGPHIGKKVGSYIAAAGHFRSPNNEFIKNTVSELGFEYLVARGKEEFLAQVEKFVSQNDRSIVFECMVAEESDTRALKAYRNIEGFVPPESLRTALGKFMPEFVRDFLRSVGV